MKTACGLATVVAIDLSDNPPLSLKIDQGHGGQWHVFVDNVRFWSMLAIVGVHGMKIFGLHNFNLISVQALQTPLKFGTTGFFLISGFLLGERLQSCRPLEYFWRRVRKVFLPWLVWISILSVFLLALDGLRHRESITRLNMLPLLLLRFKDCLLYTSFWFVPNILLALVVLLLFRRYLYDLRLGAGLLAAQLFYIVNIYMQWVPSSHLEALLGFVFDLWLGSYASRHIAGLLRWLFKIDVAALVGLALTTGLIALGETRLLTHLNSPDPLNTLRLSNQIFSFVIVLLILKCRTATWPRFINVRRDTFGIYLAHAMVLVVCLSMFDHALRTYFPQFHIEVNMTGVALWMSVTAMAYMGSLGIIWLIGSQSRLRWLVGADQSGMRVRHADFVETGLAIPSTAFTTQLLSGGSVESST